MSKKTTFPLHKAFNVLVQSLTVALVSAPFVQAQESAPAVTSDNVPVRTSTASEPQLLSPFSVVLVDPDLKSTVVSPTTSLANPQTTQNAEAQANPEPTALEQLAQTSTQAAAAFAQATQGTTLTAGKGDYQQLVASLDPALQNDPLAVQFAVLNHNLTNVTNAAWFLDNQLAQVDELGYAQQFRNAQEVNGNLINQLRALNQLKATGTLDKFANVNLKVFRAAVSRFDLAYLYTNGAQAEAAAQVDLHNSLALAQQKLEQCVAAGKDCAGVDSNSEAFKQHRADLRQKLVELRQERKEEGFETPWDVALAGFPEQTSVFDLALTNAKATGSDLHTKTNALAVLKTAETPAAYVATLGTVLKALNDQVEQRLAQDAQAGTFSQATSFLLQQQAQAQAQYEQAAKAAAAVNAKAKVFEAALNLNFANNKDVPEDSDLFDEKTAANTQQVASLFTQVYDTVVGSLVRSKTGDTWNDQLVKETSDRQLRRYRAGLNFPNPTADYSKDGQTRDLRAQLLKTTVAEALKAGDTSYKNSAELGTNVETFADVLNLASNPAVGEKPASFVEGKQALQASDKALDLLLNGQNATSLLRYNPVKHPTVVGVGKLENLPLHNEYDVSLLRATDALAFQGAVKGPQVKAFTGELSWVFSNRNLAERFERLHAQDLKSVRLLQNGQNPVYSVGSYGWTGVKAVENHFLNVAGDVVVPDKPEAAPNSDSENAAAQNSAKQNSPAQNSQTPDTAEVGTQTEANQALAKPTTSDKASLGLSEHLSPLAAAEDLDENPEFKKTLEALRQQAAYSLSAPQNELGAHVTVGKVADNVDVSQDLLVLTNARAGTYGFTSLEGVGEDKVREVNFGSAFLSNKEKQESEALKGRGLDYFLLRQLVNNSQFVFPATEEAAKTAAGNTVFTNNVTWVKQVTSADLKKDGAKALWHFANDLSFCKEAPGVKKAAANCLAVVDDTNAVSRYLEAVYRVNQQWGFFTPGQVRETLYSTATQLQVDGRTASQGLGVLNLDEALLGPKWLLGDNRYFDASSQPAGTWAFHNDLAVQSGLYIEGNPNQTFYFTGSNWLLPNLGIYGTQVVVAPASYTTGFVKREVPSNANFALPQASQQAQLDARLNTAAARQQQGSAPQVAKFLEYLAGTQTSPAGQRAPLVRNLTVAGSRALTQNAYLTSVTAETLDLDVDSLPAGAFLSSSDDPSVPATPRAVVFGQDTAGQAYNETYHYREGKYVRRLSSVVNFGDTEIYSTYLPDDNTTTVYQVRGNGEPTVRFWEPQKYVLGHAVVNLQDGLNTKLTKARLWYQLNQDRTNNKPITGNKFSSFGLGGAAQLLYDVGTELKFENDAFGQGEYAYVDLKAKSALGVTTAVTGLTGASADTSAVRPEAVLAALNTPFKAAETATKSFVGTGTNYVAGVNAPAAGNQASAEKPAQNNTALAASQVTAQADSVPATPATQNPTQAQKLTAGQQQTLADLEADALAAASATKLQAAPKAALAVGFGSEVDPDTVAKFAQLTQQADAQAEQEFTQAVSKLTGKTFSDKYADLHAEVNAKVENGTLLADATPEQVAAMEAVRAAAKAKLEPAAESVSLAAGTSSSAQASVQASVVVPATLANSTEYKQQQKAFTSLSDSQQAAYAFSAQLAGASAQQLANLFYRTSGTVYANAQASFANLSQQQALEFFTTAAGLKDPSLHKADKAQSSLVKTYAQYGFHRADWTQEASSLTGKSTNNYGTVGLYGQNAGLLDQANLAGLDTLNFGAAVSFGGGDWEENYTPGKPANAAQANQQGNPQANQQANPANNQANTKVSSVQQKAVGVFGAVGLTGDKVGFSLNTGVTFEGHKVARSLLSADDLTADFNAVNFVLGAKATALVLGDQNTGLQANLGANYNLRHRAAVNEQVTKSDAAKDAVVDLFALKADAATAHTALVNVGLNAYHSFFSVDGLARKLFVSASASYNFSPAESYALSATTKAGAKFTTGTSFVPGLDAKVLAGYQHQVTSALSLSLNAGLELTHYWLAKKANVTVTYQF